MSCHQQQTSAVPPRVPALVLLAARGVLLGPLVRPQASGDHELVPPAPADVRSFYEASLVGLRFLDARLPVPRRFGADADARWANFRGHMTTRDRLDLLLRDGDAEHPGAFSARVAFELDAVAEDDAVGAEWPGLEDGEAEALVRAQVGRPAPGDVLATLRAAAAAWGLSPAPADPGHLSPPTRCLLAGSGAILATAAAFVGRSDLAFGEQVAVVASHPGERHLAMLAAATLGSRCPALVREDTAAPVAGIARWDRAVMSLGAASAAQAAAPSRAAS